MMKLLITKILNMSFDISLFDRVRKGLENLVLAFIIIGYVVGTGSIMPMVVYGTKYGFSVFWVLLVSCFFTYFLLAAISRCILGLGNTLIQNFNPFELLDDFVKRGNQNIPLKWQKCYHLNLTRS